MSNIINILLMAAIAGISPAQTVAYDMSVPTSTGSSKIDRNVYTVLQTSSPVKIIDNSDGYTYYCLSIYKAPFTSRSNLYLVETEFWFTPGCVPADAGYSQYTSGTKLGKGTVTLGIIRYISDTYCYGGEVALKTFWPQSNNFTYTVSSTYGGSVSTAWQSKAGASYSSGNGATITASASEEASATLSWSQSSSTVTSDPLLSVQFAPDSSNKVIFTYQILNPNMTGSVTYYLDAFLLFEMKTNHRNCGANAFQLSLDATTRDYWYKNSLFVHEWRLGDLYQYSDTLDCLV